MVINGLFAVFSNGWYLCYLDLGCNMQILSAFIVIPNNMFMLRLSWAILIHFVKLYALWREVQSVHSHEQNNFVILTFTLRHFCFILLAWASCQVRKIASCACAGNPETFSPPQRVSDPDIHHGTCVTRAVIYAGIAYQRFPLKSMAEKTFPAFLAHVQTWYVNGMHMQQEYNACT